MSDDQTLLARLRAVHQEITESDGGECDLMAMVREAAARIEALEEALRWIKNMPLPAPPLDDPAHNMRTIATRALGDSHE